MLVLSRKEGERISIGPEIEVIVLGIRRGRVKLGFSGPQQVLIRREEVKQRTASAVPDRFALRMTEKPSEPFTDSFAEDTERTARVETSSRLD